MAVAGLSASSWNPCLLIIAALVLALSRILEKCKRKRLVTYLDVRVTPRYLYLSTILRISLFNLNVAFFEGPFNIITLHFDVLKVILFFTDHDWQMSSRFWSFSGLFAINTISSANPSAAILIVPIEAPKPLLLSFSSRSLINKLYKMGPSLLPCRTPRFIKNSGEIKLSMTTFAGFEENKFFNHPKQFTTDSYAVKLRKQNAAWQSIKGFCKV